MKTANHILVLLTALFLFSCGKRPEMVLESEPTGAGVWSGKTLVGRTPLICPNSDQEYYYTLRYPGCKDTDFKGTPSAFLPIDTKDGKRLVALVKLEQQEATDCVLWCKSIPEGAEVLLDGEPRGTAPLQIKGLSSRPVEVTFKMKDRETVVKNVQWDETQTTQEITATLHSKMLDFYRQKIKEEPMNLFHYTDLGHHLILEGQYDEAIATFETGLRLHLNGKSSNNVYRLWSEVDRVINVQYLYGDSGQITMARRKTLDLMRRLMKDFPDCKDMNLYLNYVNCADILKFRKEAQDIFSTAWAKWPDHKTLKPYIEKRGFSKQ